MSNKEFYDSETEALLDDMRSGNQFANEPEFEFDTSDTSESELDSAGFVDMEGLYHFCVEKVELNFSVLKEDGSEQTPHVRIVCKVQHSAPKQSPEGSMLSLRLYVGTRDGSPVKKGSIDSMHRAAIGLGLERWADVNGERRLISVKSGTTKFNPKEFELAVDRHFMAKVKREKSEGYDDKFVIPMGQVYHPSHPDVASWPRNTEALKAAGYAVAPAATTTATTAAKKNPAKQAAAKADQPKQDAQAAQTAATAVNMDDF